jgi:hypothetical protein
MVEVATRLYMREGGCLTEAGATIRTQTQGSRMTVQKVCGLQVHISNDHFMLLQPLMLACATRIDEAINFRLTS